jgi:hypothetical protein
VPAFGRPPHPSRDEDFARQGLGPWKARRRRTSMTNLKTSKPKQSHSTNSQDLPQPVMKYQKYEEPAKVSALFNLK